jgi:hypothetical protein
MCEYHLRPGDMFRTNAGLGLIVEKKGGYFYYSNVGDDQTKSYPKVEIKRFYGYCDDRDHGQVLEVILLPNRKYRRKRK